MKAAYVGSTGNGLERGQNMANTTLFENGTEEETQKALARIGSTRMGGTGENIIETYRRHGRMKNGRRRGGEETHNRRIREV